MRDGHAGRGCPGQLRQVDVQPLGQVLGSVDTMISSYSCRRHSRSNAVHRVRVAYDAGHRDALRPPERALIDSSALAEPMTRRDLHVMVHDGTHPDQPFCRSWVIAG